MISAPRTARARPAGRGSSIDPAMPDTAGTVTALLIAHREGDGGAIDRLVSLLYVELRRLAHAQLRQRRPGDSLTPSACSDDSYFRRSILAEPRPGSGPLLRGRRPQHASHRHRPCRSRARKKRGGPQPDLPLREDLLATTEEAGRFLDLDEALKLLERRDPRLVRVVECRFFAGLSEKETAAALAVTERTVQRDWRRAKGWLRGALLEQAAPAS